MLSSPSSAKCLRRLHLFLHVWPSFKPCLFMLWFISYILNHPEWSRRDSAWFVTASQIVSLRNIICRVPPPPRYAVLRSNFLSGHLECCLGMDEWLPHALVVNICWPQNFHQGWKAGHSHQPELQEIPLTLCPPGSIQAFPRCWQGWEFGVRHCKVWAMSTTGVSELLGQVQSVHHPHSQSLQLFLNT